MLTDPQPTPDPTVKIPSLAFIIALLLLKSRPSDLSRKGRLRFTPVHRERQLTFCHLKEYFTRLRSYIKGGGRLHRDKTAFNHLDSASYWRDRFNESQDVQRALRAKVSELERNLETLTGDGRLTAPTSQSKCRSCDQGPNEASPGRNLEKLMTTIEDTAAATQANTSDEDWINCDYSTLAIAGEFLHIKTSNCAHRLGSDVLHQIYLLRQTMAQPVPNPIHLASTLDRIANAVCGIVTEMQCSEEMQTATVHLTGKSTPTLQQLHAAESPALDLSFVNGDITPIARVFSELLDGLGKLSQLGEGSASEGRIIYCYVKMFQCLLERICRSASIFGRQHAKHSQAINPSARTSKKMSRCLTCRERHLKCDQRMPRCRNCKQKDQDCKRALPSNAPITKPSKLPPWQPAVGIIKLCALTVTMMKQLDTKKATHRELLEGFIFVLFEKVSKGLKQFVFDFDKGERRGEGAPGADLDDPFLPPHGDIQTEDAALQAQAPYLIWILERAQAFLPQQTQCAYPEVAQPDTSSNNVATFARNKLQYTLLKAMFGDRAPPDYVPTLNPPCVSADAELQEITMPEADVKDWYKHEVWRLLGWDVLRSHGWRGP